MISNAETGFPEHPATLARVNAFTRHTGQNKRYDMTDKRYISHICDICGTEHGAHQAHQFPREVPAVVANGPALVAKTPRMVANKVANTSRHGQYADKARRREYMRAYMAAKCAGRKR